MDSGTQHLGDLPQLLSAVRRSIQDVYLRYDLPWVLGFSGGKDSTATLQVVWQALAELPKEQLTKTVTVVASDTLVENPMISRRIGGSLAKIREAAQAAGLPFETRLVAPSLGDTFWVNLIGKGYPAPTTRFRWCTERLKIKPTNNFIMSNVATFGEVVVVLGVRKAESATRAQLMQTHSIQGNVLRRHSSLPGAHILAPIEDLSTDEVWAYLLQTPSPWGDDNRNLAALYRSASSGECPLVIDDSTPSCGKSRFGCWVCTVASNDSSMEALVDDGEEWLEPLLELRDYLAKTTDPEYKRDYRGIRGRNGHVAMKKDGTLAARSFTLPASKVVLLRLLRAERSVRRQTGDESFELVGRDELREIRRLWRYDRQDWADDAPKIYRDTYGVEPTWAAADDLPFDADCAELLSEIAASNDVPPLLLAKLLEVERDAQAAVRRTGVTRRLNSVLAQEWRSESEILAAYEQARRC
jgi:DNA sulfur modification protein DndC